MNSSDRGTFLQAYQWAEGWQGLPWAHEEPTLFLAEIHERRGPGTAVDLGCGAGTDSVWLAGRGWDVTALDFVPKALEFTRQRAEAAGVRLTLLEADVASWQPDRKFDLVLDHGLLHNLDPELHTDYRRAVLDAMAPDGVFLLLHWHPLYPGQPDGRVGPHRAPRESIRGFFAPELVERQFALEAFEDLPDMVGGGMSQAVYWFVRNPAHDHPAELLDQIRETLRHQGSGPPDAGPARGATDALLARVIGPGRLGLVTAPVEASGVETAITGWSERHGLDTAQCMVLLHALADAARGGVCTPDPQCSRCSVRLCRRLRPR